MTAAWRLFSLAHFAVNSIDESALIELSDQARIDNVLHRDFGDFGIELR